MGNQARNFYALRGDPLPALVPRHTGPDTIGVASDSFPLTRAAVRDQESSFSAKLFIAFAMNSGNCG